MQLNHPPTLHCSAELNRKIAAEKLYKLCGGSSGVNHLQLSILYNITVLPITYWVFIHYSLVIAAPPSHNRASSSFRIIVLELCALPMYVYDIILLWAIRAKVYHNHHHPSTHLVSCVCVLCYGSGINSIKFLFHLPFRFRNCRRTSIQVSSVCNI